MSDLVFEKHEKTGRITSIKLYGTELLNASEAGQTDLRVNGLPLKTRRHPDPARAANEDGIQRLRGKFNGAVIEKMADGFFRKVVAGVYEMERT